MSGASELVEGREVFDPFLNKTVKVSDKLTDRLRGRYAIGPTMDNGEPEFGWREFTAPPIQHEAAAELSRLSSAHSEAVEDARKHLAELSASRAEVVALREALAKARGALERDRSQVADGLTKIKAALAGRAWLREGRGSYAYDDERYQQEFGHALDEIGAALEPLRIIAGDWTDCPTDFAEIIEARKHLAELSASRAEVVALREALAFYADKANYRQPSIETARERLGGGDPAVAIRSADGNIEAAPGRTLSLIELDRCGTRARTALAGEKPVGAGVETALASIPQGAIDALRNNQRQLDVDGCEVGVSRQAIDEVLAGIDAALSKSGEKP